MEALSPSSNGRIEMLIPGFKARFYDPPSPWHLIIHTRERQKNWVVRGEWVDPLNQPTPSTVIYEDKGYRIMDERDAGTYWIYCLKLLSDGDLWYSPIFLNYEDLARDMRRKNAVEKVEWLSSVSGFYQALFGWLPSHIQDILSDKLCFNSGDASRQNAIIEVVAGFYTAFRFFDQTTAIWIGVAMVLMGFVRWAHVFASGEPCGQILLEGTYRILSFLWPVSEKEALWK